MSDTIQFEANTSQITAALNKLAFTADNLKPSMQQIARFMKTRVGLSFKSGQDPYGSAWSPIIREGQKLVDTGRLRSSITTRATRDEAVIGTNTDYAAAHQYGKTGPVTVAQHQRTITHAFGKKLSGPVTFQVKSHTKQMNLTARPFMPTQAGGMPKSWGEGILNILTKNMQKAGLS